MLLAKALVLFHRYTNFTTLYIH